MNVQTLVARLEAVMEKLVELSSGYTKQDISTKIMGLRSELANIADRMKGREFERTM